MLDSINKSLVRIVELVNILYVYVCMKMRKRIKVRPGAPFVVWALEHDSEQLPDQNTFIGHFVWLIYVGRTQQFGETLCAGAFLLMVVR